MVLFFSCFLLPATVVIVLGDYYSSSTFLDMFVRNWVQKQQNFIFLIKDEFTYDTDIYDSISYYSCTVLDEFLIFILFWLYVGLFS